VHLKGITPRVPKWSQEVIIQGKREHASRSSKKGKSARVHPTETAEKEKKETSPKRGAEKNFEERYTNGAHSSKCGPLLVLVARRKLRREGKKGEASVVERR